MGDFLKAVTMGINQLKYQKTPAWGMASALPRPSLSALMVFALGLVGCAGSQSPQAQTHSPNPVVAKQAVVLQPAKEAVRRWDRVPPVPPTARQALIDARDAMQAKRWTALDALAPVAADDPVLGSYAEYWRLRRILQDTTTPVPDEQIRLFLSGNQDEYLENRLKSDWIVAAARTGNYALVRELSPVNAPTSAVKCAVASAQNVAGQPVDVQDLLASFSPSQACWSALDQLYARKVVSKNQVRDLMRDALENNRTSQARRLAAIIFTAPQMKDYTALMASPQKWLDRNVNNSSVNPELVSLALSRLGRGQRDTAAAYIDRTWAGKIPQENLNWVWGQFGLISALRVEDDAAKWYRRSGRTPMTDYNNAWQVRAELRQATIDWKHVSAAIDKMNDAQKAEPVWVYWSGRAHDALGHKDQARAKFQSIVGDLNFYGQLAIEELGLTPSLPPQPQPLTPLDMQDARTNAGLLRAVELFKLGWRPEAVPEWNYALRGMNDRQLRAAAEFAREQHIYDRVVNTSLLTKNEIDFSQRFIAPFEGRVTEQAKSINLDPAWVYGLIRQESRFITDARSGVGASGLMQLMPATAKWVANKIDMRDFSPSRVNEFEVNTVLGTNYLNMVLGQLDGSQVLASAGYNAGPGRPRQWRARLNTSVEGAIFAETIPFTETRLYVKNVLSNATYYAMMFSGQPQSLKGRLGTISP
ncbi:lytic transglycosylase [Alcaligenes faecalis]|uniref:lytic transglycosylase domain-containing protein n=1 Tax=Alcaligenes faecalis TaxID=511 RepID=UPI000A296BD2|nr:transglycosylase SLT domain-containing protein [Alcaligenes faecalis]ARP52307.1 lytic transglycosylase [Alcaligenes faecalis]